MIRTPDATETPEQLCERFAPLLSESMRAHRRTYLRWGRTIDQLRITVGSKESEETVDDSRDLPDALRVARPAARQAYRALVAIRAEIDPAARLMPAAIAARIRADDPLHLTVSMDTLNHALRDLRDRELAWSHPERGWVLGREQPRLPISAGQSDRPSAPEIRTYAERMAGESSGRFSGGAIMRGFSRNVIWVPGEKTEYGVVVLDAADERPLACTERTGTMRVPTRSGRLCTSAAARGELVRTEGKYAVVKFPGVGQIKTKILGDWQLAGRTEPEPETADVASAS